MDALARLCAPVLNLLGIPAETVPLMLVRPVSGSGALAVASDLMAAHGPDSYICLLYTSQQGPPVIDLV